MDHIDKEGCAPDASLESDPQGLTDYSVGYGKPPMIRRFKSGDSGNRRGRLRGSKNRKTIVREIANEMHTLTEDGGRRRRSTLELMLLALRNRAAEGNARAFREYQKYLAKFEPQETHSNVGVLVAPAGMTPEEAIAEGEKANEKTRARRAAQSQE
jgi:hypothetical protein